MCSKLAAPRGASASPSATRNAEFAPDLAVGRGFPRQRRILKRADFQAVYDGGVRVGARLVTIFAMATGADRPGRVGLTVTRKIGNSVVRNRCKRLLREAVRQHWRSLPTGTDVVLLARYGLATAQAREVEREIARMLPKAAQRLG